MVLEAITEWTEEAEHRLRGCVSFCKAPAAPQPHADECARTAAWPEISWLRNPGMTGSRYRGCIGTAAE